MSVAIFATLALTAASLFNFQRSARDGLEDRFESRVAASARFVSTYVDHLAQTESLVAEKHLSGGTVSDADFQKINDTFGFQAAVLLNDRGELLNVYPARPDIIGQNLASRYPHLTTAVGGGVGVSSVTASAAEGVPVVAVAVPFATPHGLRVYSGAYAVEATPLAAFLANSTPIGRQGLSRGRRRQRRRTHRLLVG